MMTVGISVEGTGICNKRKECKSDCLEKIHSFYTSFCQSIGANFIDFHGCFISARLSLLMPAVITGDCLLHKKTVVKIELANPKTWVIYRKFVNKNKILAVTVNPPRQVDFSLERLNESLAQLSDFLGVPAYAHTSHSPSEWCSSPQTITRQLAIDTDDILSWHNGNSESGARAFHELIPHAGVIYISYPVNLTELEETDSIEPEAFSRHFSNYVKVWAGEKLIIHKPMIVNY